MSTLFKTVALSALLIGGAQLQASAQKNRPTPAAPAAPVPEESDRSFQDLLEQIRDRDASTEAEQDDPQERPRLPTPEGLPTLPEPNTRPVFPADDGEPRELPWAGLKASTAFEKIEGGVQHTLSKLECMDNVTNLQLETVRQYTAVGESVTCGYKFGSRQDGLRSSDDPSANVLITSPLQGQTIESQMDTFRAQTEEDDSDAVLTSSNPVVIKFADRQISCPNLTYSLGNGAGTQLLSNTICQVGDWRLRFRMIAVERDNEALPANFARQFASTQSEAIGHVDRCNAFRERLANEQPSGVTGITYNAVAFPYVEQGESCYAGNTSSEEGSIVVRFWPDNPNTPMTADFISPNGQYQATPTFRAQYMWANVPAEDVGPAAYLLMREQADGTITIYTGYTRIPTDGRFYQDAIDAYEGKTDATFLGKQNPGGGWTMMGQ